MQGGEIKKGLLNWKKKIRETKIIHNQQKIFCFPH